MTKLMSRHARRVSAIRAAKWLVSPGVAVVIDTETTDFDGQIVEIAVLDAATGQTLLNELVRLDVPIEPSATAVHGITDQMVAGAPSWAQVWPKVEAAIGGRVVVAYNAPFDQTLRELGPGFAFLGRQVHFEIDVDHFYIDLLFFHVVQLRYAVIELKTTKFDPRDAGQLGFYVALVDGQLRIPDKHQPTVGILLVATKNDAVVRYSLASTTQPVAVSRYELSVQDQAALPDEQALVAAVSKEIDAQQEPSD